MNKVRVTQDPKRVLSAEMKQWLIDHKDYTFKVERTYEDRSFGWPVSFCVKLYKVDFWITEDLLIEL